MSVKRGEGPTISKEWLDELLDRKLPQALDTLRRTKPLPIADFVKLVQLERRENPVKAPPREVEWLGFVSDEEFRRRRDLRD
jgi:hypothetical protein